MPGAKRNQEIPVNDVLSMRSKGLDNMEIARSLQPTFQPEEISDAMNQADIKSSMSPNEPGIPPGLRGAPSPTSKRTMNAPMQSPIGDSNQAVPETVPSTASPIMYQSQQESSSQSFAPMPQNRSNYNVIEEIAESIVKEKWEGLISGVGDIRLWKEKVDADISSVKQEILRTQHRLENLQKAVIGKISDYQGSMTEVGSDIKALEKVFEKILGPLTTNIKELDRITKKLKKK